MTKAVITFKDGKFLNINADLMEIDNDRLNVYNGQNLVAYIAIDTVVNAYISEQNGKREG